MPVWTSRCASCRLQRSQWILVLRSSCCAPAPTRLAIQEFLFLTVITVLIVFADREIPVDDMEVEEPEESDESDESDESEGERHCMFTVELDPLFDFATAVAVFTLQHDTEEIVKRFEISALCWVLRSPKTVYDPIRVLRALESREVLVFHPKPESDRAAIVAALAPRLAAVPADLLLDLLRQEPHLSRIDEFTKLVLEPHGCNRERRHSAPDPLWAYAADLCCARGGDVYRFGLRCAKDEGRSPLLKETEKGPKASENCPDFLGFLKIKKMFLTNVPQKWSLKNKNSTHGACVYWGPSPQKKWPHAGLALAGPRFYNYQRKADPTSQRSQTDASLRTDERFRISH
jgi:hypothetical protein